MNFKQTCKLAAWLSAFSVVLTGCFIPHKQTEKRPGEVYGEVDVSSTADMVHWGSRRELRHWGSFGKRTLIWPNMKGSMVQDGDVALFGAMIYGSGPHATDDTYPLFAVEGLGPAVDVNDEVLALWARSRGSAPVADPFLAMKFKLTKQDGAFILEGYGPDYKGTFELRREELVRIIQEVKRDGKLMKDPRHGTPYFKRAEAQQ